MILKSVRLTLTSIFPASFSHDPTSSSKSIHIPMSDSHLAGSPCSSQVVLACMAGVSPSSRASPVCGQAFSCELLYMVRAYMQPSDLMRRYVFLTLAQTLYSYFIEGDIVFVGKRKTFDKRVSLFPLCSHPLTCLALDRH